MKYTFVGGPKNGMEWEGPDGIGGVNIPASEYVAQGNRLVWQPPDERVSTVIVPPAMMARLLEEPGSVRL
jgi:hypothetical protein